MRGCLSSSSFAILVNGNAKGWVKASRGLRQGDPLSPFLFTLVADVLSRLMIRAEEAGITEGFLVGRIGLECPCYSLLMIPYFSLKPLWIFFKTLRLSFWFLGKVSEWPLSYLGLPLGGNPKTIGFWDPVVERISRRLDGWKKTYLSLGGRITLIQSCLSHIPSYFLSLFKIPVSIASKIEKMQRDFLWSGVGEGKRDHLIRWEVVSRPREMGGLGFGKTSMRNSALLGKWLWRFPRERSGLWHKVIASIYGTHPNGWDANMGEIDLLQRLMSSLHSVLLSPSSSDSRAWSLSSSGSFSVKSFFYALSKDSNPLMFLPAKFLWSSKVPSKVKALAWLFNLVGVIWVPPRSIEDMLVISFRGLGNSVRGKILWQIACLTLIWMVWQERNNRIFEDKGRTEEVVWDLIWFYSSLWASCTEAFRGVPLSILQINWIGVCV
ncbi:putative ribonuclease H protein [Vitis vinifera]|uniref:Putative ribonuclease H protein n=1 Tax=Vitis vinifera TaxID=29760 RepID=A0A438DK26_VITVI|nr:putative ribonuclease H protein [Vitis vinifera]